MREPWAIFLSLAAVSKQNTKIYAKFLFNKLFGVKLSCNWFIGSREEDENVQSLQQNANMTEEDKFWPKKLTPSFGSGELE